MGNNKMDELMKEIVMDDSLKEQIRKQTIQKEKGRKHHGFAIGKVAMAATLSVVMLGTITVAAATNKEKIAQVFVDIFNLDEKGQERLLEEGFVQNFDVIKSMDDVVSVTENGITVSVKQTLADSRCMDILVHVKSDNGLRLDGDFLSFDEYSCSYEGVFEEECSPYEKYFLFHYNAMDEDNETLGDTMELVLKDIWEEQPFDDYEIIGEIVIDPDTMEEWVYDENGEFITQEQLDEIRATLGEEEYIAGIYNEETGERYEVISKRNLLVEAEWKLKWKITKNEEQLVVPLYEMVKKDGNEYYLRNLEITPLSYKLEYNTDAVYDPFGEDYLNIAFVMEDGAIRKYCGGGSGSVGDNFEWWRFFEVMDLSRIESVVIEGVEIPVTNDMLQGK